MDGLFEVFDSFLGSFKIFGCRLQLVLHLSFFKADILDLFLQNKQLCLQAVYLLVVLSLTCGGLAQLALDFFDVLLFLLKLRLQVIDHGLLVPAEFLRDFQLLVCIRHLLAKHFVVLSKLLILFVLGVLFRCHC